jgi:hypothetical protein
MLFDWEKDKEILYNNSPIEVICRIESPYSSSSSSSSL